MVKKQQPWSSRFKEKPGPKIAESDIRTERLAMRVHPDLIHIVDQRAREQNLTRSAYIERLLVGYIQADPRNPKIDSRGKLVENAASPLEMMNKDSIRFGEKWSRFNQAHAILMGTEAPKKWIEEYKDYWMGEDMEERE
jgi:hypothetical protein